MILYPSVLLHRSSRTFSAVVVCASMALLSACGGPEGGSASGSSAKGENAAKTKTEINYANERDPRTLDPANFEDFYDGEVGALLHQTLVRFGKGTDIVPALAESWEAADDRLSISFKMREGVVFHNGKKILSTDVKYSMTRLLDPATNSQRTWIYEPYLIGCMDVPEGAAAAYAKWVEEGMPGGAEKDPGVKGVETPDDMTVVMRFSKPYLPFLTMLAMPNASVIALGTGLGDDERPVGAGPWKLERWDQGERLVMHRFDDFWKGPAKMPVLNYRVIAEASTWRAEFESGNVDFYTVSEDDYRTWRNDPERLKYMEPNAELSTYYLSMANNRPPFDDVRVRKAAAHAVDADELFEFVQLGKGKRAHGPVPDGIYGYQEDIAPTPFDLDLARKLLEEADAVGAHVDLYYSNQELDGLVCQAARDTMEQAGFRVSLHSLDRAAFRKATANNEADMWMGNWFADYPDIENFLLPLFHSSEIPGSNRMQFSDPEVDALIDKARFSGDPDERIRLFQQVEDKVRESFPAVFLWHRASVIAVNPVIEGFEPHVMLNGCDYHGVSIRGQEPQ